MKPLHEISAAVVGTGFIGPVHVEALRRLGVRVAGIVGSSAEKSAAAAESLGLARGYRDLRELLSDRAVDVVHLTSPNRYHREQVLACLAAGKHVVCEKPLAMTSAETGALVEAAKAHPHLVTAVNYNVRFYPLCLQARAMIRNGEIGDILHVTGSYMQDWLLHPTDYNWRVEAGADNKGAGDARVLRNGVAGDGAVDRAHHGDILQRIELRQQFVKARGPRRGTLRRRSYVTVHRCCSLKHATNFAR